MILNSSVAGSVVGSYVGGLVGTNSGTVMYCHSTATVTGGSGLIEENSGNVVASYATSDVTDGRAGLVGDNYGTIRHCYATGDVLASSAPVGGLVANNLGEISYSYATGDVWSQEPAAGLVANNEGAIVQCYATGSGGMALVADRYHSGTVLSCYALSVGDGGGADNGIGILLTDTQMRRQESFTGWDFVGARTDGSFDHWTMPGDGGYPVLTAVEARQLIGSGTADDPYLVGGYPQLMATAHEPLAAYRLTADIDLGGQSFSSAIIPVFWGHLDGAGHGISNLAIAGAENLGLFGVLYDEATIVDLDIGRARMMLVSEEVYPDSTGIGILAARNRGSISGCSASVAVDVLSEAYFEDVGGLVGINEGGEIHRCLARLAMTHYARDYGPSSRRVGGLVGHNSGAIAECNASCYTNGRFSVLGGLIGRNDGNVADCYANGYLSGNFVVRLGPSEPFVGGLVGENAGTIVDCYANAPVAFTPAGGGFVGGSTGGSVSGSYFLAETDSGGPDNGLGTPLSAVEMRRQASFLGWDFENTWTICEDLSFPTLRWEQQDCDP